MAGSAVRVVAAGVVLTSVAVAGYGAAIVARGESVVVPATLGLAITFPPTLITLIAVVRVAQWKPEAGPVMVLAATFLRMVWALGVVAVLQGRAVTFGTTSTAIAQWTTGFYLLTLATETALLWRLLSLLDRPSGVTGNAPSSR